MPCFNHEESPEQLQSSEGGPGSGVAGESRMVASEQLEEKPAVESGSSAGEQSD
jgi:hypothetical protein